MSLHLHENRKKTETRVPDDDSLVASSDDLGINQRPRFGARQLQKNDALQHAELRGRNPAPVAGLGPPVRQRVRQVAHQIARLSRTRVNDSRTLLPQEWIPKLKNRLDRHSVVPFSHSDPGKRPYHQAVCSARTCLITYSQDNYGACLPRRGASEGLPMRRAESG